MFLAKITVGRKGEGSRVQEGKRKVGKNGQATLKIVPSLLMPQFSKTKRKREGEGEELSFILLKCNYHPLL